MSLLLEPSGADGTKLMVDYVSLQSQVRACPFREGVHSLFKDNRAGSTIDFVCDSSSRKLSTNLNLFPRYFANPI